MYDKILKTIVTPFVSYPEHIEVAVEPWKDYLNVTLRVHATDTPKVMGGGGKMSISLASLVMAAARKAGHKINFEILEATVGNREPEPPFQENTTWDADKRSDLVMKLEEITNLVLDEPVKLESRDKEFVTLIDVSPTRSVSVEVLTGLNAVFRAIGKANGRKLSLHIKPKACPPAGNPGRR